MYQLNDIAKNFCFDMTWDSILSQLQHVEDSIGDERALYSHITCATDTNNVRIIWDVVKTNILENAMKFIALNWSYFVLEMGLFCVVSFHLIMDYCSTNYLRVVNRKLCLFLHQNSYFSRIMVFEAGNRERQQQKHKQRSKQKRTSSKNNSTEIWHVCLVVLFKSYQAPRR